jgi:hypothetical protein
VSDLIARPTLPTNNPAWLLGAVDLAAIHADDRLLDRLAAGDQPHPNDPDPAAALLAAWLDVVAGGAL